MKRHKMKIGIIGCGMMGGALIKSISRQVGGESIYLSDFDGAKVEALAKELGANCSDNKTIVRECDYVIFAVKPAFLKAMIQEIVPEILNKKPVIVTIAAGVKIATIREYIGNGVIGNRGPYDGTIVRLMPNLPATIGEAMIGLCTDKDDNVTNTAVAQVKNFLSLAGETEQVSENLMDAVTAISGSGPAYVFMFIEALADAAVKLGIPRKQAYVYAAQTVRGSAGMVLDGGATGNSHPAVLKDAVCSPAGTTIDAVQVLEESGFRAAVIDACVAAYEKSVELGKK